MDNEHDSESEYSEEQRSYAAAIAANDIFREYTIVSGIGHAIPEHMSLIFSDRDMLSRFVVDLMSKFPWGDDFVTVPEFMIRPNEPDTPRFIPGVLYYLIYYVHICAARAFQLQMNLQNKNADALAKETSQAGDCLNRNIRTLIKPYVIKRDKSGRITQYAKAISWHQRRADLITWTRCHNIYFNLLCRGSNAVLPTGSTLNTSVFVTRKEEVPSYQIPSLVRMCRPFENIIPVLYTYLKDREAVRYV